MDAFTVLLIIMGVLLLTWVIFCACRMGAQCRRQVAEAGFTAHVKCDRCKEEYEVSSWEYAKDWFVKEKHITRTKIQGAALVDKPDYSYYGKRFVCPHCKKKCYGEILNRQEIFTLIGKRNRPVIIRWAVICLAGGMIIFAITGLAEKITELFR